MRKVWFIAGTDSRIEAGTAQAALRTSDRECGSRDLL
jgi:hypothetical protein